jgi:ribonuclease H / adenosylcobalamin/alpha-ribazole phosphatase
MTDRLWLVRHASTAWTGLRWCGRSDVPLAAHGIAEAADLAARLARVIPDRARVVSSPLGRARETAAAIATARWNGAGAGRVEIADALVEVDFGAVDGLTWPEVEAEHPDLASSILRGDAVDWPRGERAVDIAARVDEIRSMVAASPHALVLVSHAAVLGGLAGRLTRSPAIGRTALAPASSLELRREGATWHPITGRV